MFFLCVLLVERIRIAFFAVAWSLQQNNKESCTGKNVSDVFFIACQWPSHSVRAVRERASEPPLALPLVSFRVLFSRDFSWLPQM